MLWLNNKNNQRLLAFLLPKNAKNANNLGKKSKNLLLTYCSRHLIFFAQDGGGNLTKPEVEVVPKRPYISTINVPLETFPRQSFS